MHNKVSFYFQWFNLNLTIFFNYRKNSEEPVESFKRTHMLNGATLRASSRGEVRSSMLQRSVNTRRGSNVSKSSIDRAI